LFFLALFLVACSAERYDNYQVVRLSLGNSTDFELAYEIADMLLMDIWGANALEGWMDVMLTPTHAPFATKIFPFSQYVRIPNVQADIDESEKQREQSRRPDDFFSDFQPSATIDDWLAEMAAEHPTQAKRISIGTSYLGSDIYALDLGNDGTRKPAFLIHCGIHAREWITPSTCCWIIDQLLNQDSQRDKLLSTFQWIIIPVLNIDGYDYTHTSSRLWRKNRQPNSGSTCIGTDLNRNYGFRWSGPGSSGNPCSDTYYGSSAFSGPEAAAVRDIVEDLTSDNRLISFFDIHAYSSLLMSPWGYTCNSYPPDYDAMDAVMTVAAAAIRAVNGRTYGFGAACQTIYQTSGDSTDYTYGDHRVVHSYCIEASGNSFTPPTSSIPSVGSEIWAGVRETALSLS